MCSCVSACMRNVRAWALGCMFEHVHVCVCPRVYMFVFECMFTSAYVRACVRAWASTYLRVSLVIAMRVMNAYHKLMAGNFRISLSTQSVASLLILIKP